MFLCMLMLYSTIILLIVLYLNSKYLDSSGKFSRLIATSHCKGKQPLNSKMSNSCFLSHPNKNKLFQQFNNYKNKLSLCCASCKTAAFLACHEIDQQLSLLTWTIGEQASPSRILSVLCLYHKQHATTNIIHPRRKPIVQRGLSKSQHNYYSKMCKCLSEKKSKEML